MHLLARDHQVLARTLASVERFAIMVRVTAPRVYGHEAVELECDVTGPAFAPAGT